VIPATVVAWLEAVVRAHGPRPALLRDGRACTYGELWARSQEVAGWLLGRPEFAPGAAVALIGRNTTDYLAAYFGVLVAGGVAVPLNERLAPGEIDDQLAIVGAAGLLVGDHEPSTGLVPVWPIAECRSDGDAARPALTPGSAACILLTSGSTGRPKGVVHSHGTLLHAATQLAQAFPLAPGERTIAFLPFFASIPEQVLPALLSGAAVDVIDRFDPERVAAACRAGGTTFDAVPTIMARLLDHADHDALRRLRWVSFASEPMPVALLHRWWDALPEVRTHNFYGMTECLPITHAGPELLRRRPDSVGFPYPTSEVAIVDESGRELGPGEQGEVVCRTPARMVGYLGERPATGGMRTGDLGTLAEDGSLVLTGRLKDLIITGGFNVAPAEIEAVACRHPSVASAVVVGLPDPRWGETPVLVAVAVPGAELAPQELLSYCRRELVDFKRPSAAGLVKSLPMTGIGKSAKGVVRRRILEGEIELVRA
jgi:acyl-CoA synthetase (AMP-forming)/AMP-acid ligase II